jgi:hypothetical protein
MSIHLRFSNSDAMVGSSGEFGKSAFGSTGS